MSNKTLQRTSYIIIAVLLLAMLCQGAYFLYTSYEKSINHEAILELINDEITYEEDTLDDQLAVIDSWLSKRNLYNEDYGRLYERKSLIYKHREDDTNYARCLGYALYYLKNSDDTAYTANLFLDLSMFYITNNNYDCAKEALEDVYALTSFEDIEDLQVKSYAYRLRAIIEIHDEDYEAAEEDLKTAKEVINQSDTGIYEDAYRAMIAANMAKLYFFEGRYDEAQVILDEYEDSELFEQTVYASVLARDFILPYYEAASYMAMVTDVNIDVPLDKYIEYCEKYDYIICELNTLLYLNNNYPPKTNEQMADFYALLSAAYERASDAETLTYTELIDGEISDSMTAAATAVSTAKQQSRSLQFFAFVLSIVLIVIGSGIVMIKSMSRDSLTGISNRGYFNKALLKLKTGKTPYGIIMIDIDDFKKVNDTYGHGTGDEVLMKFGEIFNDFNNTNITPYRYGGEEFVIIVKNNPLSSIEAISENIRIIIENTHWNFGTVTVSIGIATSDEGFDSVLERADKNLYASKSEGKNRTTFN
ncbi:MAG: GGDEF domain-containing protein [Eubacterium sp.]|nr:GGDEF domain-containing protein [Eubacterium sp.]